VTLPTEGDPVSDKPTGNSGKLALIFAAVSAWNIYDIMTATEVPRQPVMIMQYVFLACTLLGLVAALIKFASGK
jgi:multisubunit Na+/H+ antiporter MnhE subunit